MGSVFLVFGCSFSSGISSAFCSIFRVSSIGSTFVRQLGQLRYGSGGVCCRFMVFRGAVKFFLQEGFWHVNALFFPHIIDY